MAFKQTQVDSFSDTEKGVGRECQSRSPSISALPRPPKNIRKKPIKRFSNYVDIEGKRFNNWTVLEFVYQTTTYTYYYKCKCDCGTVKNVEKESLKRGLSKSCGCLQKSDYYIKQDPHGLSHTRLYHIWNGMKGRCYSKDGLHANYKRKGIEVCEGWMDSFMAFYNWALKSGYEKHLTIDRADNNGNYSPENCRWITQKEQCYNTDIENTIVDIKGEQFTFDALSVKTGIKKKTLQNRHWLGDRDEDLIRPIKKIIRKRGERKKILEEKKRKRRV